MVSLGVTGPATLDWHDCGSWCRWRTRSSGSTWPTRSRWWWSPTRLQGAGPQDVPLPGLGSRGRVGLGRGACDRERVRRRDSREHNRLKPTQAQTVIAAAILRHIHAVVTTGQVWDPEIATHGTRARRSTQLAA